MTAVPVPAAVRSSVPDGTRPTPYSTAADQAVIPLHLAPQPQENPMANLANYKQRTVQHHEWAVPTPADPAEVALIAAQVEGTKGSIVGAGPLYYAVVDGQFVVGYAQDVPTEVAP